MKSEFQASKPATPASRVEEKGIGLASRLDPDYYYRPAGDSSDGIGVTGGGLRRLLEGEPGDGVDYEFRAAGSGTWIPLRILPAPAPTPEPASASLGGPLLRRHRRLDRPLPVGLWIGVAGGVVVFAITMTMWEGPAPGSSTRIKTASAEPRLSDSVGPLRAGTFAAGGSEKAPTVSPRAPEPPATVDSTTGKKAPRTSTGSSSSAGAAGSESSQDGAVSGRSETGPPQPAREPDPATTADPGPTVSQVGNGDTDEPASTDSHSSPGPSEAEKQTLRRTVGPAPDEKTERSDQDSKRCDPNPIVIELTEPAPPSELLTDKALAAAWSKERRARAGKTMVDGKPIAIEDLRSVLALRGVGEDSRRAASGDWVPPVVHVHVHPKRWADGIMLLDLLGEPEIALRRIEIRPCDATGKVLAADSQSPEISVEITEKAPSARALAHPTVAAAWPAERLQRTDLVLLDGAPVTLDSIAGGLRKLPGKPAGKTGGQPPGGRRLTISVWGTRSWEDVRKVCGLAVEPDQGITHLTIVPQYPDTAPGGSAGLPETPARRPDGKTVAITLTEPALPPEILDEPPVAADWREARRESAGLTIVDGTPVAETELRPILERLGVGADAQRAETGDFKPPLVRIRYHASRPWSDVERLLDLLGQEGIALRRCEVAPFGETGPETAVPGPVTAVIELTELPPGEASLGFPEVRELWSDERLKRAGKLLFQNAPATWEEVRARLNGKRKGAAGAKRNSVTTGYRRLRIEIASTRPWSDVKLIYGLCAHPEIGIRRLETVVVYPDESQARSLGFGAKPAKAVGKGSDTGRAIEAGADFLVRAQKEDGAWEAGSSAHGDGVSSLALLALMSSHIGPAYGNPHWESIRLGLDRLVRGQDAEGCLSSRQDHRFTYAHAFATRAMCEAHAATRRSIYREAAERAVRFAFRCQNSYGGWRYGVKPDNSDASVTGTVMAALAAAPRAGVALDPRCINEGLAFLDSMTDEETGRTGYRVKGEQPVRPEGKTETWPGTESEALTALALSCRLLRDPEGGHREIDRLSVDLLMRKLPRWDPASGCIDLYYWYYGTLALSRTKGAAWQEWRGHVQKALIPSQNLEGEEAGSWPLLDPWSEEGGPVYATSMAMLTLALTATS